MYIYMCIHTHTHIYIYIRLVVPELFAPVVADGAVVEEKARRRRVYSVHVRLRRAVLKLRTTTSQKCAAVIKKSNTEEEGGGWLSSCIFGACRPGLVLGLQGSGAMVWLAPSLSAGE